MKIHLTQQAKNDLKAIYHYSTRQWGKTQADTYYKGINEKLHKLTANPKIGASYPLISPECRRYILDHHIVLYEIESDKINIVSILHKNMNIDT